MQILGKTRSICPHCLKNIEAEIVNSNEEIQIHKKCDEHGFFKATFWRGKPSYNEWVNTHAPMKEKVQERVHNYLDCPHTCGLCANHSQKTCTLLLELCDECNLHCPVCFADSKNIKKNNFKSLDEIKQSIDFLHSKASQAILQLSGGEPTLYPQLIELIEYANPLFSAVQLNTNGILLAEDASLAQKLKKAGLSWVFLQFDGTDDKVHKAIRGKNLQEIKLKAIEHCKEAELSLVLVSTLVAGINDNKIDTLLDFALAHFPHVRGLHFQPMTFSGRNNLTKNRKHITLPEVIQKISEQSRGRVKIEDALPSSCEHSLCSFHCRYYVKKNQELEYIHANNSACDCEVFEKDDAPQRSIQTTILSWQSVEKNIKQATESNDKNSKQSPRVSNSISCPSSNTDAFDAFIARARTKIFSISCMAFQDAHTLDLERLQNCCVHIYDNKQGLIPFCAYNLTSLEGKSLYRNI